LFYGAKEIYIRAAGRPSRGHWTDFVKTLRLPATLAALILTASTAYAAVMDFGNALGPSGRYTSQTYYQAMLGGQPMTAAQQAYADQEDQLRQLGFQSELGGDAALGQMFYRLAYGMAPPSALDLVNGGSGLGSSSTAPSGLGAGSSGASDGGSSYGSDGVSLVATQFPGDPGIGWVIAVPEASTWAMMLLGFAGLGYAGWRGSRKPALHSA
jgi:PEP-CTERM motif